MEKNLEEMEDYVIETINSGKIFGANISFVKNNEIKLMNTYGYKSIVPKKEINNIKTIYDLASLTKIVVTWYGILQLCTKESIHLDTTLNEIYDNKLLNEFTKQITVFELLTHSSGLSERTFLKQYGSNYHQVIEGILKDKQSFEVGTIHYSNKGFILLGDIIEKVTNMSLNEYAKRYIFDPLKIKNTFYNVPNNKIDLVAPTEFDGEKIVKGVVHDENARFLNHPLGHAGLFSTIEDLTRFFQSLFDCDYISRELLTLSFSGCVNNQGTIRGLGWNKTAENCFSHLGFTGTSVFFDFESKSFMIILTNRIHPDRSYRVHEIGEFREKMKQYFLLLTKS